jgi:hypothetical protein
MIPDRQSSALTGKQFVQSVINMDLGPVREDAILQQFVQGNMPNFMRNFVPITVTDSGEVGDTIVYYVAPDYLCIGSDDDFVRVPMNPLTAQKIADQYECMLPTRKMVIDTWKAAPCEMTPTNLPPTAAMTTTSYFSKHNDVVQAQLAGLPGYHLGVLVSGIKKDVVITPQLLKYPKNVAIFGWIKPNGNPIQGLNPVSHSNTYADYSHGIRLVLSGCELNGVAYDLRAVFNSHQSSLISDEGVFTQPRYVI